MFPYTLHYSKKTEIWGIRWELNKRWLKDDQLVFVECLVSAMHFNKDKETEEKGQFLKESSREAVATSWGSALASWGLLFSTYLKSISMSYIRTKDLLPQDFSGNIRKLLT